MWYPYPMYRQQEGLPQGRNAKGEDGMIEKNRKIKAVCSCLGDMLLLFAAYLLANYLRFNYIRFFQEGGAGPALDIAQDVRTLAAGAE